MTATSELHSAPYVLPGDTARLQISLGFLPGFDPAPGLDLGTWTAFGRTPTASGVVLRQDSRRGLPVRARATRAPNVGR